VPLCDDVDDDTAMKPEIERRQHQHGHGTKPRAQPSIIAASSNFWDLVAKALC